MIKENFHLKLFTPSNPAHTKQINSLSLRSQAQWFFEERKNEKKTIIHNERVMQQVQSESCWRELRNFVFTKRDKSLKSFKLN